MTQQEFDNLKVGDKVKYCFFTNLTYLGKDDRHVILSDSLGKESKIFIELFMKYGMCKRTFLG